MALQITSPVTTDSGISLATAYARIVSMDPFEGTQLTPAIAVYASKEAYENGDREINIAGIPSSIYFPYNRQADGVDTLMLCHTAYNQQLALANITSVIEGLY